MCQGQKMPLQLSMRNCSEGQDVRIAQLIVVVEQHQNAHLVGVHNQLFLPLVETCLPGYTQNAVQY